MKVFSKVRNVKLRSPFASPKFDNLEFDPEDFARRQNRFIQEACRVIFLLTTFMLLLALIFSIFISWQLWSGTLVAAFFGAFIAGFSWGLARTGRGFWAARINITFLTIILSVTYWQAPYFALYFIILFLVTIPQIMLGLKETWLVGSFLFANTLLYSIVNNKRFYAPDGQAVTLDYGTFIMWWVLIASIAWVVSFLYKTVQHDNQLLNFQALELKKAQLLQDESETRYRALSEASFEGIAIHDQGIMLEVNQSLSEMFGYPTSELLGKPLDQFVLPVTQLSKELQASLGELRLGETLAVTKAGSYFPIESDTKEFVYKGRSVKVSTIRDITARKQTEEALKQSQHQLLQAQKLESVGRLAGGVAHDFNNLLTIIISSSELLLAGVISNIEDQQTSIEEIRDAGLRAATLTRQLLAFSRQQILEPRIVNFNQIVTDTGNLMSRLIGKNIELKTVLEPNLAPVRIDPGQFEQVVMNLLLNARDALPDGGIVTIETANVSFKENSGLPQPPNPNVKTGDYVVLSVSDNGIGMDSATQARIFEPYFTTKEPGRGTGLGLATIYGIVQQSAGYIQVESMPRVGTTFKIYLPHTTQEVEMVKVAREKETSGGSLYGSETILVVEDEEPLQSLIRQILESFGYKVLIAGDGLEALALLENNAQPVELILTDLIMPNLGGMQLLEVVRKKHTQVKLVSMSGYSERVAVQQGLAALSDSYVQKPFTPNRLLTTIKKVLVGVERPTG